MRKAAAVLTLFILGSLVTAQAEEKEKKFDRFLQSPPQEIYSAYRNYREHLDYLFEIKNVPISTVPKAVPLKGAVVEVHPSFVTQFILPKGTKVLKAYTSLPVKFFKTIDNTVLVEPAKSATTGNVVIYYVREDGKKETLNLILKTYDPTNSHREPLYTQIVFTEGEVHSPAEVLDKYYSIYRHYPERPYEIFRWDGISYLIQRSSVYGTVKAGKYRYLVTPTVLRE